ncbi:MAG: hypothetical protein R3F54_30470 [Alphaproteobacteria bacterium]
MRRLRLGRRDRLLAMSAIVAIGVLALGALFAFLQDRGVVAPLGTPAAAPANRLSISDHQAAFLRAIEIGPEQRNAYFGLAESRELQGDHQGAVNAMRTFVHLTPADDPFRRRADATIWEWQALLDAGAAVEPRR